jgi:hypothetical protein
MDRIKNNQSGEQARNRIFFIDSTPNSQHELGFSETICFYLLCLFNALSACGGVKGCYVNKMKSLPPPPLRRKFQIELMVQYQFHFDAPVLMAGSFVV